ncbi:MAG: hypothetical protein ACEQSB_03840 [Undibacterium sp.]
MFQPVLVFDSVQPSPFVARGLRMEFRLVDIRDPKARMRDNTFPIIVIWDYHVNRRVLREVPAGEERFFRPLAFVGEMWLERERKGTIRHFQDPIGFLAYCYDTDIGQVRYHAASGGFSIRQTGESHHGQE